MTTLGGAIGPGRDKVIGDAVAAAVDQYLAGRNDAVETLQAALTELARNVAQLTKIGVQQSETSVALARAADALSAGARALAMRVEQPPPVVNVTVPDFPEMEAPVVNVTVEPADVTVLPASERKGREVTTVHRDSNGLITSTVTEETE